jgi:(E)-4-hydroxy-3-methylbut-2-enyl-diphosphate synthase
MKSDLHSHSQRSGPAPRRVSVPVKVVTVGGGAPVVVQSMTNTDTADIEGTVAAGCSPGPRRLGTGPYHRRPRRSAGRAAHPRPAGPDGCRHVPLVGDFHYIGHKLLRDHPACAEALANTASTPAMWVSAPSGPQFSMIIEHRASSSRQAGAHRRQLGFARPGHLLTKLMDENAKLPEPKDVRRW